MGASRLHTIRRSARAGMIGLLAAAGTALVPSVALADTTIGSVAAAPQTCTGSYDLVQVSSTGASYVVPAPGGNITSWNFTQGTATVGAVALEVWRPAGALSYTLVGVSPLVPLGTAIPPINLAVQTGDVLGLRIEGSGPCGQPTVNSGDVWGFAQEATPAPGTLVAFGQGTNLLLNVSANIAGNTPPPPPPPSPGNTDDCKDGGWQNLVDAQGQTFENQGDCVSSVASGDDHHSDH